MLTGAPVGDYWLNRLSNTAGWNALKYYSKKNLPVMAACLRSKYGLVSRHAYSVLSVHELKRGGRVVHRIVKVRNPWSTEKYRGPWSDSSSLWTADFKRQVGGVTKKNDGIFFLPLSLFK